MNALGRQEKLLPFLLDRCSYPHGPKRVRMVQTHASFVFVVSPFVYKVKKAVNFGFLDFSTLQKRRHFCAREVILNQRLSPKVYLGVVPIANRNGRLSFGGNGRIVEYAVRMRELSEDQFLDRLLPRGKAGRKVLDRIARELKRFYQAQHPTRRIESWGRIDRLRLSTDENFRQAAEFVGKTISPLAFETVRFYTNTFYERHAVLFGARLKEHRIRDCHGDLHLDHIHVTPRELNIYDCIEFNDRLRYLDVASDAAFLAMDLDYQGRPDLALHFAARLAGELGDAGMPRLMDFYKCYRAVVRGKVESFHSQAHAAPGMERRESADRARRYFRLALNYAVAGSRPLVLALMGGVASGKSTLARALGEELGWEVLCSDRIRKELAGVPLFQRGVARVRKRLYSAKMTERTYGRLLAMARARVSNGRSVILDATFSRRAHRRKFTQQLSKRGVCWRFLEVWASPAAVKKRLRGRPSRKTVSDARLEDLPLLEDRYQPPSELPRARLVKVAAGGNVERALIGALRELARAQVDISGALLG